MRYAEAIFILCVGLALKTASGPLPVNRMRRPAACPSGQESRPSRAGGAAIFGTTKREGR